MPDTDRDNLRHEQPDREPLVQYEDLEQATGFTQISNAVLRCYPELSDGEKMTYAVLKSFAYVSPETFVGEETLSRARGITVSTVSRHLSRLIETGLVKVRRRGQGKTNIWIIARIPRPKLEQYIREWRSSLQLGRNPQTQTSQNPQIKNPQNAQAKTAQDSQTEEEYAVQPSRGEKRTRRKRSDDVSPSMGETSLTASAATGDEAYTRGAGIVENSGGAEESFSTIVENVGKFAAMVAQQFGVPEQEKPIAGFLAKYDPAVVQKAFGRVVRRLDRGDRIDNPVAYFYAVVKVMQAGHDERATQDQHDEQQRVAIARNWARSLLHEWSADHVRAILADTYNSSQFVDDVMAGLDDDQ